MPLSQSDSDESFHSNVKELTGAGHPLKQALAISFKIQRQHRSQKMHSAKKAKRKSQPPEPAETPEDQ